jgi:hypothetical protein
MVMPRRHRTNHLEDFLHHDRRESHRRFIEQQQLRFAHQRPADRQHLLLTTRERAGQLLCSLLEAREVPENLFEVALDLRLVVAGIGTHAQVFEAAHAREDTPALGHQSNPFADQLVWRQTAVPCRDSGRCRRRDRASAPAPAGAALAGTVGTDQRHHLAFIDMKGDAANGLDTTVGNAQSVNFKHDSSVPSGHRATEVGLDDARILLHHRRHVLADLLAVVEHATRPHRPITSLTSCSISKTVTPSRQMPSTASRRASVSVPFIPAAGSSSASSLGSVARARAISRRR